MGFEANSLTIASHVVMVLILIALVFRSLFIFRDGLGGVAIENGLLAVTAICAFGLIIERCYYISARILKSTGLDLWTLHPAPEALSLVVGIGLYAMMIPMIRAVRTDERRAVIQISAELSTLVAVWLLIAWVLF